MGLGVDFSGPSDAHFVRGPALSLDARHPRCLCTLGDLYSQVYSRIFKKPFVFVILLLFQLILFDSTELCN